MIELALAAASALAFAVGDLLDLAGLCLLTKAAPAALLGLGVLLGLDSSVVARYLT